MSDIDELWKIVQELAETEAYVYNDNSGLMECLYCNDCYGWGGMDGKPVNDKKHEPACLFARARALLEQAGRLKKEDL